MPLEFVSFALPIPAAGMQSTRLIDFRVILSVDFSAAFRMIVRRVPAEFFHRFDGIFAFCEALLILFYFFL